jgi:hypothetical protein
MGHILFLHHFITQEPAQLQWCETTTRKYWNVAGAEAVLCTSCSWVHPTGISLLNAYYV